jgi:hypothetical protein
MQPITRQLLKATRVICIIAAYLFAGILVLQPNNRYAWMTERGGKLPLDEDSPDRVWMFATMVTIAALLTVGLSVAKANEGRRSPLIWWSILPLGYAAWRVAGVCLAGT